MIQNPDVINATPSQLADRSSQIAYKWCDTCARDVIPHRIATRLHCPGCYGTSGMD